MKKTRLLWALFIVMCTYTGYSQIKFPFDGKTEDGKPLYEMEFSPRLKLNGFANLGGNAYNSQSLNLNSANPYNPLHEKGADFNMYQTQLAWKTTYNGFEKGPLVMYVEGQWWGAPGAGGNLQLRVAYVDYNHWHVGQDWSFFGGGVSTWYNTLDWEGPNSGVWARHLQLKYYNNFGQDKSWKFEGGIESSASSLKIAGGTTPGQFSIDPILAFTKYQNDGGFIRMAVMGRTLRYAKNDNTNAMTAGWGVNVNYKTMLNSKSYFMAQGLAGSGIAGSYTLSGQLFSNGDQGTMYDGIYNQNGNFKTVPVYGGSAGIEYFFGDSNKLHSNLVLGYTSMTYNDNASSLVNTGVISDNTAGQFVSNNTKSSTQVALPYASINMMYNVTKNFLIGVEYNHGAKQIINTTTQTSDVNRIGVGIMAGF